MLLLLGLLMFAGNASQADGSADAALRARTLIAQIATDDAATKADQFYQEKADHSQIGKAFSDHCSVVDGTVRGNQGGCAFYTYKNEILHISIFPGMIRTLAPDRTLNYYEFMRTTFREAISPPKIGTNSMGVKTQYREHNVVETGIIVNNPEKLRKMSFDLPLPPEDARAMSKSVSIKISGTIESIKDGRLGTCSRDYIAPTIDGTDEFITTGCYVGARIEKISIISDGKELQSFEM